MDRTLVIPASVPVPRGNRIEVAQIRAVAADATQPAPSDAGDVVGIRDLNRGISYRLRDVPRDRIDVWRAQVRDCTVIDTAHGPQTTLTVMTADAAQSAADALSEADAAAAAAKAESDRWGGADRSPAEEQDRFW